MKRQVYIYDTTLRDGAQGMGVSFSLQDKLTICRTLDETGVHYIEGGWPGSNPKDSAFFREALKIPFRNARLTAFGSTKRKGIPVHQDSGLLELIASETPVVTVFGKSWDFHVEKALKTSLEENLDMVFQTLQYLKIYFEEVIFDAEHFFDGYNSNPSYALKVLRTAQQAGCDWIVLCDTNGGTLIPECESIVRSVKNTISIPVGIHAHNDGELAVANSLAAVENGADMVQGTVNGLGERCGNANLCSVIPNLTLKKKYLTIPERGIKNLTYISHLVSELTNNAPAAHLPFVGANAFAHKGGVHVSAVVRDPGTYEHVQPETVGNRRHVSISELSGKSNVLVKTAEIGLNIDPDSPGVQKVLEKVKEMEAGGYCFEGAEASFELLFRSMSGPVNTYFTLHGYRVITWKNGDDATYAEATIKAGCPADVEHTSADGEGPVEALDRALRKVLEKFYPSLKEVKLTDYKVRILNESAGTGAVTRVLIQSRDKRRKWGTVGVSDNIIDASWQALTDSLIYKLIKDEEDSTKPKSIKKSTLPARKTQTAGAGV